MSTSATLDTATTVPIPEERAHGLFRWNAVLSGLHAIQGFIILAISLAAAELVTSPVVSSYAAASAETFDPSGIPEVNQDEALIAYLAMEDELAAGGVTDEDMAAATDWLASEATDISQAQYDELLAAKMLRDSESVGDDEFGKAEEDELIGGDDEEDDDEEDDDDD
jgi:hypothetical protein